MIRIKANNNRGYELFELGGVIDFSYPSSKTRRGRVQGNGKICPTITAQTSEVYRMSEEKYEYRIRKLTPLESFRLMGVTDEDANKMLSVNSNSQCYKQAGNSIVVDVIEFMMRELFAPEMVVDKDVDNIKNGGGCEGRIMVLGNYMESNHDASRVVDTKGVAPTVKENHGTVTGVVSGWSDDAMNKPEEVKNEICN